MKKHTNLVPAQFAVLDAWVASSGNDNLYNMSYTQFHAKVISELESGERTETVTHMFRILLNNDNPANYSNDLLSAEVVKRTYSRTYRHVRACTLHEANGDFRLRYFYISFLNKTSTAMNNLLNNALTYVPRRNETAENYERKGEFDTLPLSAFEKILLLHSLCDVDQRADRVLGRKRNFDGSTPRGSQSGADGDPLVVPLRRLTPAKVQRMGFAVQRVCDAWTMLLSYYGWDHGVEDVLCPYLLLQHEECSVTAIPTRAEGYARAARPTCAGWPQAGTPTTLQVETSDAAYSATAARDTCMRSLAQHFLAHIRNTINDADLYEASDEAQWDLLRVLTNATRTRVPGYFKNAPLPPSVRTYLDALPKHDILKTTYHNPSGGGGRRGGRAAANSRNNQPSDPHDQQIPEDRDGDISPPPPRDEPEHAEEQQNPETPTPSTPAGSAPAHSALQQQQQQQQHARAEQSGTGRRIRVPSADSVTAARQAALEFLQTRYVHAYNCGFSDLAETYQVLRMTSLSRMVQLALMDPPFNTRRAQNLPSSGHDYIDNTMMQDTVEEVNETVRPGGHVFLFCTYEQFSAWKAEFDKHTERVTRSGRVRKQRVWTVTQRPFKCLSKPNHFNKPYRRQITHQDGVQYALHAKRNGLSNDDEWAAVDWRLHGYVQTKYPARKNIIDNIPRLAPGEQIRVPRREIGGRSGGGGGGGDGGGGAGSADNPSNGEYDDTSSSDSPDRGNGGDGNDEELVLWYDAAGSSSGRRVTTTQALRNEQKPLPLLKELIMRYTKPGDIVMDMYAGTFSVALACLTLPQHRVFVGCELDTWCFDHAMNALVTRWAAQRYEVANNMTIPANMRAHLEVLFNSHAHDSRRVREMWAPPANLPQYQCMPQHIVARVAAQLNDMSILRQYAPVPFGTWPINVQAALHAVDDDELLRCDAAAHGVVIAKSSVNHVNSGDGCFAARSFRPGEVVCTYYGTITYHNFNTRTDAEEYGEGHFTVNRQHFRANAWQMRCGTAAPALSNVTELIDGKLAVCIVAPSFCAARAINDARYLDGDTEKDTPTADRRQPNVEAVQAIEHASTATHLARADQITIRAITAINPGDELFINYGERYVLFHTNAYHAGMEES